MAAKLGIQATEATLSSFGAFKKATAGIAYQIYKIDGSDIIMEKEVLKAAVGDDYVDEFIKDVMGDAPRARWAVLDWNHKIAFVMWNPDSGPAISKMKYATACEGLFQALEGCHAKIQATDAGELSREVIEAKTKSTV